MEQTKYLPAKLKEYLYSSSKLTADFIIAKTILDNIDNFPHVYLKQIATDAQVAESTVTKFCHKLGYDGFKELRNDILLTQSNKNLNNMLSEINIAHSTTEFVDIILKEEKQITLEIVEHFDLDKIAAIVELIKKHKKGVLLSPIYMTESIAFLEDFLRKKHYDFYYIARSSDYAVIQECLEPESLIFIFSIKGEWVQNNSSLLQNLKEQNHTIVLFTCQENIDDPYIDISFNVGEENLVGKQSAYIQYLYFKTLFLMIVGKC